MTKKQPRAAVIGAGACGLTAARRLRQPLSRVPRRRRGAGGGLEHVFASRQQRHGDARRPQDFRADLRQARFTSRSVPVGNADEIPSRTKRRPLF